MFSFPWLKFELKFLFWYFLHYKIFKLFLIDDQLYYFRYRFIICILFRILGFSSYENLKFPNNKKYSTWFFLFKIFKGYFFEDYFFRLDVRKIYSEIVFSPHAFCTFITNSAFFANQIQLLLHIIYLNTLNFTFRPIIKKIKPKEQIHITNLSSKYCIPNFLICYKCKINRSKNHTIIFFYTILNLLYNRENDSFKKKLGFCFYNPKIFMAQLQKM